MATSPRPRRPWTPAVLIAACLLAGAVAAEGAEWGGIEPGVSTQDQVRARYGPPSQEQRQKVEGYDTVDWVYEAARAPAGLIRMVVQFGLVTAGSYQPAAVRVLRLEPKRNIFTREAVLDGWGAPDGARRNEDRLEFYYQIGLIVVFDVDDVSVTQMFFTPRQPSAPAPPGGARPGGGPPPPATPGR